MPSSSRITITFQALGPGAVLCTVMSVLFLGWNGWIGLGAFIAGESVYL